MFLNSPNKLIDFERLTWLGSYELDYWNVQHTFLLTQLSSANLGHYCLKYVCQFWRVGRQLQQQRTLEKVKVGDSNTLWSVIASHNKITQNINAVAFTTSLHQLLVGLAVSRRSFTRKKNSNHCKNESKCRNVYDTNSYKDGLVSEWVWSKEKISSIYWVREWGEGGKERSNDGWSGEREIGKSVLLLHRKTATGMIDIKKMLVMWPRIERPVRSNTVFLGLMKSVKTKRGSEVVEMGWAVDLGMGEVFGVRCECWVWVGYARGRQKLNDLYLDRWPN